MIGAWNISTWAIRRPLAPSVLIALLALAGAAAWGRLPKRSMPSVVIPVVAVTAERVGMTPSELESAVTVPIEDGLSSVPGVKHIASSIAGGSTTILIEFRLEMPPERAVAEVQNAVEGMRSRLPEGVRGPIVRRVDPDSDALVTYATSWPGRDERQVTRFVDRTVIRSLTSIPGVASAERIGGATREIGVDLDVDALAGNGLTASAVAEAVASGLRSLPGGRSEAPDRTDPIRVAAALGEAGDASTIAALPLGGRGGPGLRVGDVGQVHDGAAPPRTRARLDGRPVVAIAVHASRGADEVGVAAAVAQRFAALSQQFPEARFSCAVDAVQATRVSYESAVSALVEGTLGAIAVVWLFLRDWRATAIAAIAIPTSILPTVAAMHALGYSFDTVSLLAISLVSGLLADDAIVEIENIQRFQRSGHPAYEAAAIGAERIGLAVIATSAAIVAVFIPVGAMPGISGRYFTEFGFTVAIAATASLVVARLLTPMLAAYFLRNHRGSTGAIAGRKRRWRAVLASALRHPGWVAIAAAGYLIGTAVMLVHLPTGYLPASDGAGCTLRVDIAADASLATADRIVGDLARRLRAHRDVSTVFAEIAVPRSTLGVTLVPRGQRLHSVRQFVEDMRPALAAVADQRTSVIGESGERDVSIRLLGDEPAVLEATAIRLAGEMRGLPALAAISCAGFSHRRELVLVPDGPRAAALGVDPAALAALLQTATGGDEDASLPRIVIAGEPVPVRVRLAADLAADPAALARLGVATADGPVPLAMLATFRRDDSAAAIERRDRSRSVAVEADLVGGTLGTTLAAIAALPTLAHLPPGVSAVAPGDAESMKELFAGIGRVLALGIGCAYLVLVLLYRDPIHPLAILIALPLSAGGAVVALMATGSPLDLSALIGLLMLMGIVGKNSILVIDAVLQRRADGASRARALLAATSDRAKPVIMTTAAMIAGMAPIVVGAGADGQFRRSMAIAVIGGLVSSTLLSLVVVPVAYLATDSIRRHLIRLFARLLTAPRS